jgi:hypothetical protein
MENVLLRSLGEVREQMHLASISEGTKPSASHVRRVSSKTTTETQPSKSAVSRRPRPQSVCKLVTDPSNYAITPGDTQFMTLPDGRQLCFAIRGSQSPNAQVVMAASGLPGSRLPYYWDDQWGKHNNHTIVTVDRPGYGLSTPNKTYTVLEAGQGMLHLMRSLGYR